MFSVVRDAQLLLKFVWSIGRYLRMSAIPLQQHYRSVVVPKYAALGKYWYKKLMPRWFHCLKKKSQMEGKRKDKVQRESQPISEFVIWYHLLLCLVSTLVTMVSEWVSEWVSDWAREWASKRVSEWVSERASESEWVSEWLSEWGSERTSERASEWVSEWASEWVSKWGSEWVSEWVSERVS